MYSRIHDSPFILNKIWTSLVGENADALNLALWEGYIQNLLGLKYETVASPLTNVTKEFL